MSAGGLGHRDVGRRPPNSQGGGVVAELAMPWTAGRTGATTAAQAPAHGWPTVPPGSATNLYEQDPHGRQPPGEGLDDRGGGPVQAPAHSRDQAGAGQHEEHWDRHTRHETDQQPTRPRFQGSSIGRPVDPEQPTTGENAVPMSSRPNAVTDCPGTSIKMPTTSGTTKRTGEVAAHGGSSCTLASGCGRGCPCFPKGLRPRTSRR